MAATPIIRQEGEGERFWFAGGGVWTMKATSAETGDSFLLFEDHVVRGKTTPLHSHPHADEAIYLLDGEILAHVEGEEHRIASGGLLFAPRGVPHAFLVTSETAHLLCFVTPGRAESFYRSVSEAVQSNDDAVRPPNLARLQRGAEESPEIEVLGPPPFAVSAGDRAD